MTDHPELPAAALRALAEAEERRRLADAVERPVELGGRKGPEPVRYGDWEKKGLAVDFWSRQNWGLAPPTDLFQIRQPPEYFCQDEGKF